MGKNKDMEQNHKKLLAKYDQKKKEVKDSTKEKIQNVELKKQLSETQAEKMELQAKLEKVKEQNEGMKEAKDTALQQKKSVTDENKKIKESEAYAQGEAKGKNEIQKAKIAAKNKQLVEMKKLQNKVSELSDK